MGAAKAIRNLLCHCHNSRDALVLEKYLSHSFNSNAFDALESRKPILGNVLEALADPNTQLIDIYGSDNEIKDTLLQRVYRRIERDNLFDLVLTATVTRKPDVKKIQDELALQLGFNFSQMSKDERANELHHKIKNGQKVLIVLCDLCKRLDMRKIGIPFNQQDVDCKILVTSRSKELLTKKMQTQINFMV